MQFCSLFLSFSDNAPLSKIAADDALIGRAAVGGGDSGGAGAGGSDDAGSQMVEQIRGEEYEPWFTPVLEQVIGGELPGEVESLFFCIQTGIGVGVLAFGFGYLVGRNRERKRHQE